MMQQKNVLSHHNLALHFECIPLACAKTRAFSTIVSSGSLQTVEDEPEPLDRNASRKPAGMPGGQSASQPDCHDHLRPPARAHGRSAKGISFVAADRAHGASGPRFRTGLPS